MGTGAAPAPKQMTEAVRKVDRLVKAAAETLGVPLGTGTFDGEGWIWVAREISEDKLDQAVPEVSVRCRPDPLQEGVEIAVIGSAWIPERREASIARQYFARFYPLPIIANELSADLMNNLKQARQGALDMAQQLPDLHKRRLHTEEKLKDRGLLTTAE